MGALHSTLVKIQLTHIERRTKIMSFEKLPEVCDGRFCANVFRQSDPRRRTRVAKVLFYGPMQPILETFNATKLLLKG